MRKGFKGLYGATLEFFGVLTETNAPQCPQRLTVDGLDGSGG
jgi:hypothetical protein